MCLSANCSSSIACMMVLPKLIFVLLWAPFLYPLPCWGWFAVRALWLQCETRVSTELAGALLTLFFAWNVAQHVREARSETKRSVTPWLSDTPTFKSINEVHALTIKHSIFFVMAGLIVVILFMLFSVYSTALWAENEWIWSILANGFSIVGRAPGSNYGNLF